jgi:hypothetical protein
MKAFLLTLFATLTFCWQSNAQQQFVEGVIVYSLRLEPAANATNQNTVNGTFTITIKATKFVKDLQLGKDFRSVLMFNMDNNTAYSLRKIEGRKYAIQLNALSLKNKQQACDQVAVAPINTNAKTIAGFSAASANISCGNQQSLVYYTRDWKSNNDFLFEQFPAFQYIPLAYDIKNEDGSVLHFELKSLDAKPIDNGIFNVPIDYKIISSEEYQQLTH